MAERTDNTFEIEVMPDGKIKITSLGKFDKQLHLKADEFLSWMLALAGGEVVKTKNPNSLAHPHQHEQGHQHHHH